MILAASKLTWYVSRSAGLIAWMLVAASIIWGLLLSGRMVRRRGLPAWLLDLHRFLGALSLVFTAIHMAGLYFDKFVKFTWADLLVPYATDWKPGSVAWGIVAFYALVAIQLTSWAMKWLPRKVWHAVHLSSVLLFVFGTIHVFTAGTDRNNRWIQITAAVVVSVVLVLLTLRVLTRKQVALAAHAAVGASRRSADGAAVGTQVDDAADITVEAEELSLVERARELALLTRNDPAQGFSRASVPTAEAIVAPARTCGAASGPTPGDAMDSTALFSFVEPPSATTRTAIHVPTNTTARSGPPSSVFAAPPSPADRIIDTALDADSITATR
jgi:hypothetical protein